MSLWVEILVSVLLLVGGFFALVGSIGLAKLPDFFTRLHAPTKATTLGVGSVVVALLVHSSAVAGRPVLGELAISLFLFITAPVVAHVLAKAAVKALKTGEGKAPADQVPQKVR
ncbi:MAG: Na+/H+ antiporter subunit G [Thermaurantiacus sp.]